MIDVLLPAYNSANSIVKCLDSIYNQTFKPTKVIIINDASTDGTEILIKKYISINNISNLLLLNNEIRMGAGYSLNSGIKYLVSKYVARVDADDINALDRFEKQLNYMETNHHIDLLGSCLNIRISNHKYIRKNVPVNHNSIVKNRYRGIPVPHPSWFVKSSVYEKYKYDKFYKRAQDQELLLRLSNNGFKFANLQDYLVTYDNPNNISTLAKEVRGRIYLYKAQIKNNLNPLIGFLYMVISINKLLLKYVFMKK